MVTDAQISIINERLDTLSNRIATQHEGLMTISQGVFASGARVAATQDILLWIVFYVASESEESGDRIKAGIEHYLDSIQDQRCIEISDGYIDFYEQLRDAIIRGLKILTEAKGRAQDSDLRRRLSTAELRDLLRVISNPIPTTPVTPE